MIHTDFYEMLRDIKRKEQAELRAALEAHGGIYAWWNDDEGWIDDTDGYPMIAVNLNHICPGPVDAIIRSVSIVDGRLCFDAVDHDDNVLEFTADDVFAGHLSFIIDYIPATDEVQSVKTPTDDFTVCSVSREDLVALGFDAQNLEDCTMRKIANKLGNSYYDNEYYIDIPIVAEALNIPYLHDTWFGALSDDELEKITGMHQVDYPDQNGCMGFKTIAYRWWGGLTNRQKQEIYDNYA